MSYLMKILNKIAIGVFCLFAMANEIHDLKTYLLIMIISALTIYFTLESEEANG